MCPTDDKPHAHDLGFRHDLPAMMGRRGVLGLLGGLGLGLAANPAAALECIGLPWETAGPYPGDGSNSKNGQLINVLTQEGVIREDIRASFGDFEGEADGVPMTIELELQDADGCTPLTNHAIYIWHCDTEGHYSLYDVTEANWLRGVGISDDSGKITFTTIFPGCYDGRWPHIHFEVFESAEAAVSGEASLLTAQIAMPQAECETVYAEDDRYPTSTRNLGRISLDTDNVFSDNTDEQIAQQTAVMTGSVSEGYHASVVIPVDSTADKSVQMAPPPGGFGGPKPE